MMQLFYWFALLAMSSARVAISSAFAVTVERHLGKFQCRCGRRECLLLMDHSRQHRGTNGVESMSKRWRGDIFASWVPVQAKTSLQRCHISKRMMSESRRMTSGSRRMMGDGDSTTENIVQVNREVMLEIVDDYENGGRESSGYVIIDVRGEEEVAETGKISPSVNTLPLPYIAQRRALAMEDNDFMEEFGFAKPQLDETIVFSCKKGMRSQAAAKVAIMDGYTDVINYMGGADDWFRNQ